MSDFTTTNKHFICAAGSYFGLPGEQLMLGSKIETHESDTVEVVLRIALTPDDIIGIAKRMEAMRELPIEEPIEDEPTPYQKAMDSLTVDACRTEWNIMDASEKSRYGSFANFFKGAPLREKDETEHLLSSPANAEHLSRSLGQANVDHFVKSADAFLVDGIARKVTHIDAPEEEESHPHVDGAVWLRNGEATDAQVKFASDTRNVYGDFECLIPWSMLTEEQRQKAKETS